MSPFICSCGTKTKEPYVIRGVTMCVLCAEVAAPDVVERRERQAARQFGTRRQYIAWPHRSRDQYRF